MSTACKAANQASQSSSGLSSLLIWKLAITEFLLFFNHAISQRLHLDRVSSGSARDYRSHCVAVCVPLPNPKRLFRQLPPEEQKVLSDHQARR
jgi:hypothetical protein